MIGPAQQIPGWMSETELNWLAKQARSHWMICEIGCWRGRSTRCLADNTQGRICAVDMWADTMYGFGEDSWWQKEEDLWRKKDWLLREFLKNLGPHIGKTVAPFRISSLEAVQLFRDVFAFDMIFIDADHEYESVRDDILAWKQLLAPGGLLCGHDFSPDYWTGVIRAVQELVPGFQTVDTIWWAQP